MVLRLRAVAARVGYVEAPVVVGYALRLVAHVAGVYDELRAEVYLRHIAVVGVRRYVEEAAPDGSQILHRVGIQKFYDFIHTKYLQNVFITKACYFLSPVLY